MLEAAAALRERERAALRHEHRLDGDVLAAGAGHAHRVPGVDDLVVGSSARGRGAQSTAFLPSRVDRGGEHVPVGIVDAGRERPAAADHEAAIDLPARGRPRARSRRRSARRGLRPTLRAGSPARSSRASSDGSRDCRRSMRSRDSRARSPPDVEDRDERQLHPAEDLRLMEAKQPGLVQQLLVLANEHARILGGCRALAQGRHDLARAAHRLVVADG